MVDIQIINMILDSKDLNYWLDENIESDLFNEDQDTSKNYKIQYEFIKNHYNQYNQVPDKTTFIDHFPNFVLLEVEESKEYLKEKLIEQYTYKIVAPIINEGNRIIIDEDSRKGVNYILDQLSNIKNITAKSKPKDLFKDADDRFAEFKDKSLNPLKGYITTGFPELDTIFGGWDRKEEYAVIAARTNQGKSWWLLYFMLQASLIGIRVGMYSGEMGTNKVGYRFDTFLSNLSNYKLSHGNADLINDYKNYIEELKEKDHTFIVARPNDFGGAPTIDDLKKFVKDYNIELLGIDQLSLLKDKRKAKNITEQMVNISIELKNMQNELGIPVIAVSQLNREAAQQEAELHNVSLSDRIVQDATTVLFLEQKTEGVVISIKKARDAKIGSKLTYSWDIDKGKFLYLPTASDAMEKKIINQIKQVERKKSNIDNKIDKKEDIF